MTQDEMICLLPTLAHAEFMTGNDLLKDLNGDTYSARGAALGYVMGVSDALHNIVHCPSSEVTSGQIRDMVRNYLTNVPAERHQPANVIVARVLKAAWPCANNNRKNGGV